MNDNPLIVIVGPTASGKTTLALDIAKMYNGEIICADSRTIYKGLDIGTAKPSKHNQQEVTHYLVDVVRPDQPFTAADFKQRALKAIESIRQKGKLPIMVGGTGLYIDAVLFDYTFGDPPDPKEHDELAAKSIEELQDICRHNNIELPQNDRNKRHLVRAIELGGLLDHPKKLRPNTLVVGITTDKEELLQRVTYRAEVMLEEGVLQEARRLGQKYGWDAEPMKANIYRVLKEVIDGTLAMDQALERIVSSDMNLAKRQLTWFKRNPYIIWGSPSELLLAIEHFVQQNTHLKSIPGKR